MHIVRHLHHCPEQFKGAVISLGNFDGVHKGHIAILETAQKTAKTLNAPNAVFTFHPHPRAVLTNQSTPFLITPLKSKVKRLMAQNIDALFIQRFHSNFSRMTAVQFVEELIVKQLKCQHLITGENFVFGHKRSGNVDFLKHAAKKYGFGYTAISIQEEHNERFSSSRVREAILRADMQTAESVLGTMFHIEGRVKKGKGLGKDLGFATANIAIHKDVIRPKYGIYAVFIKIEGSDALRPAVASFGVNPSFENHPETLEVHIFDFEGDIYGKHVTVFFKEYIRDEKSYNTANALKDAISEDCKNARKLLS